MADTQPATTDTSGEDEFTIEPAQVIYFLGQPIVFGDEGSCVGRNG